MTTTIRLPKPMLEKLQERARETGVPKGDIVERAIEKLIREDERIRQERPDLPAKDRLSHNLYPALNQQGPRPEAEEVADAA